MKSCPSNKILNPKSNRCVLKTGAIGKKLLAEQKSTKATKPTKPTKPTKAETETYESYRLSTNKIKSKSNRCFKDGPYWKKIIS